MALLTVAQIDAIRADVRALGLSIDVLDLGGTTLGTLGVGELADLAVQPDSISLTKSWGQAATGELTLGISAPSDSILDFDQVILAPRVTLDSDVYRLGRFLPLRPSRTYSASGVLYAIRAPDFGLLLGMQFSRAGLLDVAGSDDAGNGFGAGTSVIAAVERLARMAGVERFAITDPLQVLAADRAWALGQVTIAQAIAELLAAVTYRPFRFDGIGRLTSTKAEKLEDQAPVWSYRDGIDAFAIDEQPEQIANIAIVTVEDPNREAFGVRYVNDNPGSPDSTANVPIRRVLHVKDNTVADIEAALERARTALEERSRTSRTATLTIPPNPALEPLDVITVDIGEHSGRWRIDEISWPWAAAMSLKLSDASAAISQAGGANG